MTSLRLHNVEVAGRPADVRIEDGVISHVGSAVPPAEASLDGHGAALLPGLHDHHIHLLSLSAHLRSVSLTGLTTTAELRRVLGRGSTTDGWLRATGYHESTAGELDRRALDAIRGDVPVRVQHRSGALWMLNSAALRQVAPALDDSDDVERDAAGEPTGRLWRYDSRLRTALPTASPELGTVGQALTRLGITSVTDATPDLDAEATAVLARAHADGSLPQHLTLLGAPHGAVLPTGLSTGPQKLLLRDHDLPSIDELIAMIRRAHENDRAVAVHCVTRHALILTLAAIEEVGPMAGDRIEHAAVVPPDVAGWMARLGVAVVTQPDFLRSRGEAYRREVDAGDLPHLYPYRSLVAAGVRTCASSDAPYGALDPWQVIATAADRPLGSDENVPAHLALAGYLSPPGDPGGEPRRIRPGAPADMVLLDAPLAEVLAAPHADRVRSVWIDGRPSASYRNSV